MDLFKFASKKKTEKLRDFFEQGCSDELMNEFAEADLEKAIAGGRDFFEVCEIQKQFFVHEMRRELLKNNSFVQNGVTKTVDAHSFDAGLRAGISFYTIALEAMKAQISIKQKEKLAKEKK